MVELAGEGKVGTEKRFRQRPADINPEQVAILRAVGASERVVTRSL